MRNPDWVRDEIILAMDLYLRAERKQLPAHHADVIRLSQLLNALPIHAQHVRNDDFRNPNGISMILGNFLGIDPMHAQPGLSRNNHLQEQVWQDFVDRSESLRHAALAIEQCAAIGTPISEELTPSEDEGFREGELLGRLHRVRERNRTVVEKKKSKVIAECGRLACEACGFDFQEIYGELGRGFAECHHSVPLAEAVFVRVTRLSDLAIVCANCHRILHRVYPTLRVTELRRFLCDRHTQNGSPIGPSYAIANLS